MAYRLENRSVIAVSGEDARHFLQGLLTIEIDGLDRMRFGALLSPQGKILFTFFVAPYSEGLLFDVATPFAEEFVKRMTFYRLRAKAVIADVSDQYAVVWSSSDEMDLQEDPRFAALGYRSIVLTETAQALEDGANVYDRHRLSCGVPELGSDYQANEIFPHDAGFDRLNGVDFNKGCYVGQEVVSRFHHKSSARKRFVVIDISGPAPEVGEPVMLEGKSIGTMGSNADGSGLALVRLDRLPDDVSSASLTSGDASLTARLSEWLNAPTEGEA